MDIKKRRESLKKIFDNMIYALTGSEFSLGRDNITVVSSMLEAGIKIVQYREKDKYKKEKYEECLKIRELTRKYNALFIVNDDLDIAISTEADGLHIGQDDLPIEAVRNIVGDSLIVGLSTHSIEQANSAYKKDVDYIGVGPIFTTKTKKDVCSAVGLEYLDYVVKNIDMPFVAIGGIKMQNIEEVIEHKAKTIAMITEIVGASDIKKICIELLEKIK